MNSHPVHMKTVALAFLPLFWCFLGHPWISLVDFVEWRTSTQFFPHTIFYYTSSGLEMAQRGSHVGRELTKSTPPFRCSAASCFGFQEEVRGFGFSVTPSRSLVDFVKWRAETLAFSTYLA